MKPNHLAATLALLLLTPSLPAADWPAYRGPDSNGTSAETGFAKRWPADGPRVVWKAPAPLGFSSFTVADGRAFTLVAREIEGLLQEVVLALDAATGRELWAAPIGIAKYDAGGGAGAPDNKGGDGPRSTPAVSGPRVYASSANLEVFCLDAATGAVLWQRDILREHAGVNINWKNAASPVLDGERLFLAGGGPGQALLALDARTGRTLWQTQDDKMTHSTPTLATIHGVRQVIFFTQKGLVAVAPATGDVLWRYGFRFSTSTAMSPVVCGDLVYCSAGYGVGAGAVKVTRNPAGWTAEEVYRIPGDKPLANHWSTPVFHHGHLYGMFSYKEYATGALKCVEAATGRVVWEKEGFGPGNVTLADGHLIALSDAGQLVLIEATPRAYNEVARAKILAGKCWSTPVLSGGRLYARSTKEGVCLDLAATSVTATLAAADSASVPLPETKLVAPAKLITAEKFDQPSSLAPKGKPGWRGGIGEWEVKDGALHARDEKPNPARPNGHEAVCEYVTEAGDIIFTARFKLGTAPHVGFVCRDTHQPNHHLGRIMVTPGKVWLQKMTGISKETRKEVLQTIETSFDPEQWYQVTIEVRGDEWFARVGTHTLTARHERFKDPKGRIGLVAKGEGAQFKDVAIWHAAPKS